MRRNFSKYFLCIMLLYNNMITSTAMKTRIGNIDIEDFLNKVIISKKFEELAEKIADKAVERIQNIQHFGNSAYGPVDKKAVYRVSERETEEYPTGEGKEDNRKNITFKYIADNITNSSSKSLLNKIDSEAFKRKESKFKKGLSLKFKYFTKKAHQKLSDEEGDVTLTDLENTTQITGRHEDKTVKNYGETKKRTRSKLNNNKRDRFSVSSTEDHVFKEKAHENSKDDSAEHFENDDHKISKENIQFKEQAESKEMKWEDGSHDASVKGKDNNNKNIADDAKHLHHKESENNTMGRIFRSKTDSDLESSKDTKDSSAMKDVIKSKEVDKVPNEPAFYKRSDMFMIRKEGSKLYAHEKHPDYEDYHNEIDRIQKQLKRRQSVE